MFIEVLFIQSKGGSNCPVADEWIDKTWHKHAMEYYSPLTRKEILTHATTWMSLEDIMLNEISQS